MISLVAPASKVRVDHQRRLAYVYVRQSTQAQVEQHKESTERQYGLQQRAMDLGWPAERVLVIDEDQGRSATSAEHRHGFRRLVTDVGLGQVGAVLMLEASRLARSCGDWHRLIEICSLASTLIADEHAIYDPRDPNDRLLLGVKGTISEAELFTLRTRLYEGRWNKARKGELGRSVPTGFVVDADGGWDKDPDIHVQDRIGYVFALFQRHGVVRRVLLALIEENLKIPVRVWDGPRRGQLDWKAPTYGALIRMLHNPAYAGAFSYGQWSYDGAQRSPKTGKTLPKPRPLEDWPVCIVGHHPGYLSWEEFLNNQHKTHDNWFRSTTRGAPREGRALLQGIVWCGRCGAKMSVNSYSAKEQRRPAYICQRAYQAEGAPHVCQSMSGGPIDDAIVEMFLEAMTPAQLEVSLQVVRQVNQERDELKRQWGRQLDQARLEARRAERQYDAVDPDNRLVAGTLEARWNEKLDALKKLEAAYADAQVQARFTLTEEEQKSIQELARDLPAVWSAPTTTDKDRKKLLRHAISEVQLDGVTQPGRIELRVTWRSGAVTTRQLARLPVGSWAPRTSEEVVERIRALAVGHSVSEIAERLCQEGFRSAHGKEIRRHHVMYIARSRGIKMPNARGPRENRRLDIEKESVAPSLKDDQSSDIK